MSHLFDNKVYIEPSTGARIVSSVPSTPIQLGSGNLAILAESKGGLTALDGVIYEYSRDNVGKLKDAIKGGLGLTFVDSAFAPSNKYGGAQRIFFVRTQVSTRATATITNSAATFVMETFDKGAYLSDATNGLKWKIIAGVVDNTKMILQLMIDGVTFWSSPETTNTYTAMKTAVEADATIYGKIIRSVTVSSGSQTFAVTGSFTVFTGGTDTAMAGTDVDAALDLLRVKEVDVIYIGSENATFHAKVTAHSLVDAEIPRIACFGGALGETKAQVLARAAVLNSHKAILCYPGVKVLNETGTYDTKSPMYTAAYVAGLICGLPPQTPATYKPLAVGGFEINATDGELVKSEREELITGGVTFCRFISGIGFTINKAVTTLLANSQMINSPGGESREVSIERIKNQLNKDLQVGSRLLFVGGNVNTVGREDVVNYTKGYLTIKTATQTVDNLLISFLNVSARLVDDAWFVDYGFVGNTPINHVFFTGAILRANL